MQCKFFTYHIHSLLSAPKIHTDLLWDLSLLFIGLSTLYFAAVFFFRNRQASNSAKMMGRKKTLAPMISEFLFFEEESSKNEKSDYINLKIEIRELLKDVYNRKALSSILLDLQKDVSGDTKKRVFKLYKDLGLDQDAYVKLKSWRWEVVSQGILELTQMQVTESFGFITKFINDKRGVIRKQAEIATVTLKHEGIAYFLDTTQYKISEWQQLKLLDVIRNLEDFNPPKFKAWLTSKNSYAVLFALRLIKYYNQNDAYTSIIQLVKHKNDQIKAEAISCIKEFNILEARETLKSVFWKCNVDIKILILDTIALFGQEEDIFFLKLIENKVVNYSVRSKALSAINAIYPESVIPTEDIIELFGNQIPDDIVTGTAKTSASEIDLEIDIAEHRFKTADILEIEDKEALEAFLKDEMEETVSKFENGPILDKEEIMAPHFIPYIVENEGATSNNLDIEVDYVGINRQSIKTGDDTEISEEQDFVEHIEASHKTLRFDFLPLICENETGFPNKSMDTPASEFTDVLKYHVFYEEVGRTTPLPVQDECNRESFRNPEGVSEDIGLMEIDFLPIVDNQKKEWRDIAIKFPLPSPCFPIEMNNKNLMETFIDEEYSNMDLLEAIEELGDKREIPFLKEMMEIGEEAIKERITELIRVFSKENEPSIFTGSNSSGNLDNGPYSIFEDFFRHCDTEGKLILLEEIATVGDEKELYFLSKLLTDPEIKIRERAKKAHDELKNRISEISGAVRVGEEHKTHLSVGAYNGYGGLNFKEAPIFTSKEEKKTTVGNDARKTKQLLPLEYCFLLDELKIEPFSPNSIADIGFELTIDMETSDENKKEVVNDRFRTK